MLTELNTIAKNYEYLIKAVGAFLPFLIAIFMAYIAYQQWQTDERKRKQELYNLRYDNLFLLVLNNADRYNRYKQYKTNELDWAGKKKLDEEFSKNLHKYKFLIKRNDFIKLMNLHEHLCR